MGRYRIAVGRAILSFNVKIDLDVLTYLACFSFTDGVLLSLSRYDARHRTALSPPAYVSRVVSSSLARGSDKIISTLFLCSYRLNP